MSETLIVAWLPRIANGLNNQETDLYWVERLDEVIDAYRQGQLRIPVYIDDLATWCNWYIPAHPDLQLELQNLMQQGWLHIGCWYAAPAWFFASGETLVRNLLLARAAHNQVGASKAICLLLNTIPIVQIPQIMHGFSYHRALTHPSHLGETVTTHTAIQLEQWRGAANTTLAIAHLHTWPWPISSLTPHKDAACIQLINLAHPQGLDNAIKASSSIKSTLIRKHTRMDSLTNQWDWPTADDALPLTLPECKSHYASAQPACQRILYEAEQLLQYWAEPWATAAWIFGKRYPDFYIDHAWQQVLLCQQLIASSSYNSNQYTLAPAQQAHDLAKAVANRSIASLVNRSMGENATNTNQEASPQGNALWVVNPLGMPCHEVITFNLSLPAEVEYFKLLDANNRSLPYQLHTNGSKGNNSTVSFPVELPATGYHHLRIMPTDNRPYFLGESIAAGNILENRFLRVSVKSNGALRIEDKRSGYVYGNCNVFEDGGDIGTLACYQPPEQDKLITTHTTQAQLTIVENGMFVGTIQVKNTLNLPAGLHPQGCKRDEHLVSCELTSYITLRQHTTRVEVQTIVQTSATNHRLRALFCAGIPRAVYHVAQPFATIANTPHDLPRTTESGIYPMLGFVDISNTHYGLAIATPGLYEYEIKPTPASTIALTLYRSVTRQQQGATPEQFDFSYALIPHTGSWEQALPSALPFSTPPRVFTAADLRLLKNGSADTSAEFSLVQVGPLPIVLSSVKRSEDGNWLVIRAYNPSQHGLDGEIHLGLDNIKEIRLATLDETPGASLSVDNNSKISLFFAPQQIHTLLVRPTIHS